MTRSITLLLNIAHALDHLFLLVFATAVAAGIGISNALFVADGQSRHGS